MEREKNGGNLRLWNERDWNVVKGENVGNFINRRCSFEAEYARKTGMKKRGETRGEILGFWPRRMY